MDVALVTGSSTGIGESTALHLARNNFHVFATMRNPDAGTALLEAAKSEGLRLEVLALDVNDTDSCSNCVGEIVNRADQIDILVNNAGGTRSREDISATLIEDFKGTFDLNVFGAFELMQHVIPSMKSKGWGRIINIASIWGREYGGNISYMSAKAALIAASKHAAIALAKDGILVNSIAPGSIEHPGGSWERFQNDNTPEVVENFIKDNLPLGKFGWPEPLGDLVAYLASDRSGLITGSCIVIDGGQSVSMI